MTAKKLNIPLMDLKKQCAPMKGEIEKALKKIVDSQQFILGEDVKELERNVASYCDTKYAVGLNSGTDALILALDAMGIGQGDEVITTPFTFIATAEAIVRVGAKPVFVDIDPRTYNINPALIAEKITPKTKAILPVHIYGLSADMDSISKIARNHKLKTLEDCAQAIGATCSSKKAGSIGDAAAFSFFPSKNLGGFGDGGMVITNDEDIYKKLNILRNHGSGKRYYHEMIGYNSRLDNLQAAVINIKLSHLDEWIDGRIENALFFNEALKAYPLATPFIPDGYRHSFHLYVLRTEKAKEMVKYLNENGIESRTYYPVPLHLQECFMFLGHREGDLPESEKLSRESFSIPIFPELTNEEKSYIADKIRQFFD